MSETALVALLGPIITALVGAFGLWSATAIKRRFRLADEREQERDRCEQAERERDRAVEYSRRLRQRIMNLPFWRAKDPSLFEVRLDDLVNEASDEIGFQSFIRGGDVWNSAPRVEPNQNEDE